MAFAKYLDHMFLALWASGLWLRYATLQNLIPSLIKFCHLATICAGRREGAGGQRGGVPGGHRGGAREDRQRRQTDGGDAEQTQVALRGGGQECGEGMWVTFQEIEESMESLSQAD